SGPPHPLPGDPLPPRVSSVDLSVNKKVKNGNGHAVFGGVRWFDQEGPWARQRVRWSLTWGILLGPGTPTLCQSGARRDASRPARYVGCYERWNVYPVRH